MDVPQLSPELREALRTWFHSKDRSVYLADNTFAYLPGGVGYLSMAFISETVLSASVASVTFSNIPQDFRHLLLTCSGRVDSALEIDALNLRFNGDAGNNYDWQSIFGNSVTPTATVSRAASSIQIGNLEGANSRGNNFAPNFALIFDYSRTVEKRTLSLCSVFGNLSADTDLFAVFRGGGWRNTNVIMSLILLPNGGGNFVSGSRFQLYGIL